MASPSLLCPPHLLIKTWDCHEAIPSGLFCKDCKLTSTLKVSWGSEGKSYYMNLQWDGEKLIGKNIMIYDQNDSPVTKELTVTIFKSPHQGGAEWIGELTSEDTTGNNEANTGVFVAQADGRPTYVETKEEGSRSAEMGTSTAL